MVADSHVQNVIEYHQITKRFFLLYYSGRFSGSIFWQRPALSVNWEKDHASIHSMNGNSIFKMLISIKPLPGLDLPIENNTNPRPACI